jgi:hypothetical protein
MPPSAVSRSDGRDRRFAGRRIPCVEEDHDRRRLTRTELRLERDPGIAAGHAGRVDGRVGDALLEAQVRRADEQQERQHGHEHRDGPAHHAVRNPLPARPLGRRRLPPQSEPAQQAPHRQRVHPRTEHAQDGGQERQAVQDGGENDDRAAEPDGRQRARPEPEQPGEADGHGNAREQHRLAGRADGALHRLLDRPAASELLAESAGDEQGVVDREREAEHRRDVQHVDAHLGLLGDEADDPERGRDRETGDEQRHARRDERCEHEDQDQRRDRQGDRLGAREVLLGQAGRVLLDRAEAGQLDLVPRRRGERVPDWIDQVDRPVLVDVQPDEDVRLVGLLADEAVVLGLGVAGHPGDPPDLQHRGEGRRDGALEVRGSGVGALGAGLEQREEGRAAGAVVLLEPLGDLRGLGGGVQPAAGGEMV